MPQPCGRLGQNVTNTFVQWTQIACFWLNPQRSISTRLRRKQMANFKSAAIENEISRDRLAELLNEDLAREYQAIIGYVVYSQVLKGAEYMDIAQELEKHALEELQHALTISQQINYLGAMPTVQPRSVKTSEDAQEMLQFDLDNETDTIRN